MFPTALPDLLSFNKTSRTIFELKARLEDTSIEAITGRRQDITKATNGNVGSAHLLNKALSDIDLQARLFSTSRVRLELQTQSLITARNTVDNMGARAINVLSSNSGTGISTIIDEAENAVRTIFSLLKTRQGERSLFSGDAVERQPLGDPEQLLNDIRTIVAAGPDVATIESEIDFYFNDPTGGFQTTIYQGGDGNTPPIPISTGARIDFTVRADDGGIKTLLQGLTTLAAADNSPFPRETNEYSDLFNSAAFSITNGLSETTVIEANLGIGLNLIEKAEDLQAFERIAISAAYNEATGRDQFEASAELKFLETQLQASYTLTARLSDLTLINFLR